MADYLKGFFGPQKAPPPANEDGMLLPAGKNPTLTWTPLTYSRLRRLCRSPRSLSCFHLTCYPAFGSCCRRLAYRHSGCGLHQMVPRLGTNEPVRFLRRGYHSALCDRDYRAAYMGSTDKQAKSKRVDHSSCASARKGICFRWVWREESSNSGRCAIIWLGQVVDVG